jgi:IclR family pca regulon transcriptional regulator
MTVDITVGTRLPAFATSMGRVLLAGSAPVDLDHYFAVASFLPPPTPQTLHTEPDLRAELDRVRAQGWAMVDQELEMGLRSIAMPVTGSNGVVVGAINVSSAATAESAAQFRSSSLGPLKAAARAIDHDLQAARFTG